MKNDCPCAILNLDGQCLDLAFIQDHLDDDHTCTKVNLLLSLHYTKLTSEWSQGELVITRLEDFVVVQKVPLQVLAKRIIVHKNNKKVFLISLQDQEDDDPLTDSDYLSVQLGFEHFNFDI